MEGGIEREKDLTSRETWVGGEMKGEGVVRSVQEVRRDGGKRKVVKGDEGEGVDGEERKRMENESLQKGERCRGSVKERSK